MTASSKTAIVTGAASGIGLAVASRLLDEGWRVAGIDQAEARIEGRNLYSHALCDLARSDEIGHLVASWAPGPRHALVHAAGIMRDDSDQETHRQSGTNLWALHVGAAARLAQAALPHMPDGDGRIVFLSSRASLGRAGRGFYAASKAALDGLARSMAIDCMGRGITVNVVAPGATNTPQLTDPARAGAPAAALPIGRLIDAREVAGLVAFLLGPFAGAITGQTILQCGGASLAVPQGTAS